MKPDVIVTWPTSMDYPLWRWQMEQHRDKFDKIIIVFHKQGVPDFSEWLRKNVKWAYFIDMPEPGVAWRHNAINIALSLSENPWVWFTEMDFFVKEDFYFVHMFEQAEQCDGVALQQGDRFHPCSTLVKRETIEKTDRFFDPAYCWAHAGQVLIRAELDHFSYFTWQLEDVGKIKTHREIGLIDGLDFYHMEDITHNYDRVKVGDVREVSAVKDFLIYNAISRNVPVKQNELWQELTYKTEFEISKLGRFINR